MTTLPTALLHGRRTAREVAVRPRHLGVVAGGVARWCRLAGYTSPVVGHRAGLARLDDLLGWCERLEIPRATVVLLTAPELAALAPQERAAVEDDLGGLLPQLAEHHPAWELRPVQAAPALAPGTRHRLDRLAAGTTGRPCRLTLALAQPPAADDVTAGVDLLVRTGVERPRPSRAARPSPDGVVRTPRPWPAFTRRDLQAALRRHAARARVASAPDDPPPNAPATR